MFGAVIFDFDGVIGNTMGDNCIAWQHAFAAYDLQLECSEYFQLEGMGPHKVAQSIIKNHQLDPGIENDVVKAKEEYYRQNNTFKIYDGVKDIFDFLKKKGIPVAIVTGASRARITEHLDEDIGAQSAVIITAHDVANTKPHPEPYLKAIAQLGMVPGNCLVIENAILGIQSAKAAGCKCFALETTLSEKELGLADEIFATHKELLTKFESIF